MENVFFTLIIQVVFFCVMVNFVSTYSYNKIGREHELLCNKKTWKKQLMRKY